MQLHEWNTIDWQIRLAIRKFYGLRPSHPIITIETLGITRVEDDGMREGDLESIAHLTVEQAKNLMTLDEVKAEVKVALDKIVLGKTEMKKTAKKKVIKKKK